jgi:hypothetical protein
MSKRPAIDLSALTSEAAAPMAEASQRSAHVAPKPAAVIREVPKAANPDEGTKTANLQALAFKVSPAFRKRFRQRAANADLKLNELLFAALDAWEEKQGLRK